MWCNFQEKCMILGLTLWTTLTWRDIRYRVWRGLGLAVVKPLTNNARGLTGIALEGFALAFLEHDCPKAITCWHFADEERAG